MIRKPLTNVIAIVAEPGRKNVVRALWTTHDHAMSARLALTIAQDKRPEDVLGCTRVEVGGQRTWPNARAAANAIWGAYPTDVEIVCVPPFYTITPYYLTRKRDRVYRRDRAEQETAMRMNKAGLVCHISDAWPGPDSGATWNPSLRRWAWWTDKAGKPAHVQWASDRA